MTNSQSTREKIILDISSNQSKIKNLVLEQYIEHAQQFPFRKIESNKWWRGESEEISLVLITWQSSESAYFGLGDVPDLLVG